MLISGPASLEERWLDVFRELGEPVAILACTYTFHADFFAGLLADFAEASCEGGNNNGRSFGHIPVDVVCDYSGYKGHRAGDGFNVALWPKSARLFHPKILIALFPDEVVWSDGSLNLTPAGWRRNREIAFIHRPGDLTLPEQLRTLLKELPVTAARQILQGTTDQRVGDMPGQYLTSLSEPIGSRFLSRAPKHAEAVHLIAPFFEKGESAEDSLDEQWLLGLAQRYADAKFHIYLPQINSEPLRVQGRFETFAMAEKQLVSPIALHPVVAQPGPLHGKVVCIVYTPQHVQRACILAGSPNMTHAALMAGQSKGNIEAAWILDERWKDAEALFRGLGSKARSINEVEFIEPSMNRVPGWMPLKRASYDPLRRILRVEWKKATEAAQTTVLYAGGQVALPGGHSRGFELTEGIGWLVTRNIAGGYSDGLCPIDVPVELVPACIGGAPERTPEEWLRMLGSLSFDSTATGSGVTKNGGQESPISIGQFKWSERVRSLTAKMRYFECKLADASPNRVEQEWLRRLFFQVYDSHDPLAADNTLDQIWRVWVRLELWHAAARLGSSAKTKQVRTLWQLNATTLRRRLGLSSLPPVVRSQMRAAVKALMAPV